LAVEVAVFGSSECGPEDPLYETARRVGYLLARAGFGVVNGGYGGVMEAASRGAREGGGTATGVTTTIFSARGEGNPYLTRTLTEPDLFDRTRRLIEMSAAFIILAGKAGTLAELTFLWALHRAGRLGARPVVLLGPRWKGFVEDLVARDLLEPAQAALTAHADTPEEAVSLVQRQVTPT
jgi:uncharacterized protein (TIGR00730 family)